MHPHLLAAGPCVHCKRPKVRLHNFRREKCDPHVFYHHIRPFLAGSKNMEEAGLPNGLWYDDGTENQQRRRYSGGSNAQSPIIQLFDIFLGVEHNPARRRRGYDSDLRPSASAFLAEMRNYMFPPHRRFLEDIARVANVREFVQRHPSDRDLQSVYESCLNM